MKCSDEIIFMKASEFVILKIVFLKENDVILPLGYDSRTGGILLSLWTHTLFNTQFLSDNFTVLCSL